MISFKNYYLQQIKDVPVSEDEKQDEESDIKKGSC